MFVQLCSLLERFVAHGTQEGLWARVSSQVVHHVAFFVKFFMTPEEATKENWIQSLSSLIHHLFTVINHPFSLAFFETVIEDLDLVQEIFHGSGWWLLLFEIQNRCLNLMVKDTILTWDPLRGKKLNRLSALWVNIELGTHFSCLHLVVIHPRGWIIARRFFELCCMIIVILFWERRLLFPASIWEIITSGRNIRKYWDIVIACLSGVSLSRKQIFLRVIETLRCLLDFERLDGLLGIGQGLMCISLNLSERTILHSKRRPQKFAAFSFLEYHTQRSRRINNLERSGSTAL